MAGNRNGWPVPNQAVIAISHWAVAVLLLMMLPVATLAGGYKEITPQRVHDLLAEGSDLWLIDIRSSTVFLASHIEGAVNIPAEELMRKRYPKQKMLVLADQSLGELQAKTVAAQLAGQGQMRLFVLAGGVSGWRRAGLPMAGDGGDSTILAVMPQELDRAKAAKIDLRLFDLRSPEERELNPMEGAQFLPGRELETQLAQLRQRLEEEERAARKSLSRKLKPISPTVVLLPITETAPQALLTRHLRGLDTEVRYIEGGYLAVAPRQRLTISNVEGCPACPGGANEGGRQ